MGGVIVNLFKGISLWGIKQAISVIRHGVPWTLRLLLWIAVGMFQLSIVAFLTTYKGVDKVAEGIAEDWKGRAINGGFPALWELELLTFFRVLAMLTIFGAWIVMFFITVFTIDIAYHLMF